MKKKVRKMSAKRENGFHVKIHFKNYYQSLFSYAQPCKNHNLWCDFSFQRAIFLFNLSQFSLFKYFFYVFKITNIFTFSFNF